MIQYQIPDNRVRNLSWNGGKNCYKGNFGGQMKTWF